jgi:hypothetical protein
MRRWYVQTHLTPTKALDAELFGRAGCRARESRPRSSRRATARVTRAGPSEPPGSSDDPHLTPLQAGWLAFLDALLLASEGGLRSYVNLLDLIAIRVARELAQFADWDEAA